MPPILPKVETIVSFGDIHGDYNLAIELLTISKLIKVDGDNIKWIGGNTYVVQVGDQIDRCRPLGKMTCENKMTTNPDENSDVKILELFTNLDEQAQKEGGRVISLLGNHEIKNIMGEFDYVSYEGLVGFDENKDLETGKKNRKKAFEVGGKYGTLIGCTRMPAVIIGSNLFVHAGLVDPFIAETSLKTEEDFEKLCVAIRAWILGLVNLENVSEIITGSKYSMFWTRLIGSIPEDVGLDDPVCKDNITEVLKLFKIGSIIVGHTPQSFLLTKDINATCDGKVWRVDNGSSKAFSRFDRSYIESGLINFSRRAQYLKIVNDDEYYICDEVGENRYRM